MVSIKNGLFTYQIAKLMLEPLWSRQFKILPLEIYSFLPAAIIWVSSWAYRRAIFAITNPQSSTSPDWRSILMVSIQNSQMCQLKMSCFPVHRLITFKIFNYTFFFQNGPTDRPTFFWRSTDSIKISIKLIIIKIHEKSMSI